MHEQTFNATPLPVYPFKFIIPVAGTIVLLQGLAEILRCIVCLRSGTWPARMAPHRLLWLGSARIASL